VLSYGVVKWIFIILHISKSNKDNKYILKFVSAVPDRDTYHQPDLYPEILAALSQYFPITCSMQ